MEVSKGSQMCHKGQKTLDWKKSLTRMKIDKAAEEHQEELSAEVGCVWWWSPSGVWRHFEYTPHIQCFKQLYTLWQKKSWHLSCQMEKNVDFACVLMINWEALEYQHWKMVGLSCCKVFLVLASFWLFKQTWLLHMKLGFKFCHTWAGESLDWNCRKFTDFHSQNEQS